MITEDQFAISKPKINHAVKQSFALHLNMCEINDGWKSNEKHQLLYAEGGVIHVETRQHCFLLPTNHAAWIPAHCLHQVSSSASNLCLRMLYFEEHRKLDERLSHINIFPVNQLGKEMIYKTDDWNDSFSQYTPLEQVFFQAFLLLIPQWLDNSVTLAVPTSSHPKLSSILNYIQDNLHRNIVVDDLAYKFALSNRSLTRLFKQELGINFRTYLRISRVVRAMDFMGEGRHNVSSAAYAVGYESISAFSATFYNLVGIRPQEYMKRLASA